jgi:hypothetical protein
MPRLLALLCLVPMLACTESEPPASSDGDAGLDEQSRDGGGENSGGSAGRGGGGRSGATGGRPTAGGVGGDEPGGTAGENAPVCDPAGTVIEIAARGLQKVDLLFVVDNSASMREEQISLSEQFPRLIDALTKGDGDGDGTSDFASARDQHLGVVSTDMGLVGVSDIDRCEGLGDDGIMLNTPSPEATGCQASYPRFLSYLVDVNDPSTAASDFACIARLGTEGCGFEQQLEAGLKALWPSVDIDPATGQPIEPNRIRFLGEVNGFGQLGHGDQENVGFLRNDPAIGLSAIAIVVVTDEEDCSSADTKHFVPSTFLPASDPLVQQPLNLRCFYNPQNLYPVQRYINGLKALRPGNEQLVLFSAIAGVPLDLVSASALGAVDFRDDAAREALYTRILDDPRMQERPAEAADPAAANLVPSCETPRGSAYPPRRIVEVARGFGENGSVHSICQEDFRPAIEHIAAAIGAQLGAQCLPRPIVRDAGGLVGCTLYWDLPPPGAASPQAPTSCESAAFLSAPSSGRTLDARGGERCVVEQLAVRNQEVFPTGGSDQGWYYDDFSEDVTEQCPDARAQRIAFTPRAQPPTGVRARLQCPPGPASTCEP